MHSRTVTRRACLGRGNYSCCCHECCCGDLQEVVWFRNGIWKVDCVYSWQASGQSCCSKVRSMGQQQCFRQKASSEEDLCRCQGSKASGARGTLSGQTSVGSRVVAPGTLRTLRALEVPRALLLPELSHHVPRARVVLDSELRTTNLRKSRWGAAGGPSGMTAEHLKGLLQSEDDLRC